MEGFLILVAVAWAASPLIALVVAIAAQRRAGDLERTAGELRALVSALSIEVANLRRWLTTIERDAALPIVEPHEPEAPAEPKAADAPAESEASDETQKLTPVERPIAPPPMIGSAPAPMGATPEMTERVHHYADSLRQMHAERAEQERRETEARKAKPAPEPTSDTSTDRPERPVSAGRSGPSVKAPAARALSLEELLSTKVIVWIAAVAVALAGVFLVRYFQQQGLIKDWMKIALATTLGLGLIAGGEVARLRKLAQIAQGLVAAGIPVLYAAILGSVQLYGLIGVGPGFVLLALTTAAAIVLGLRHGQFVTLLGLIGGFLMPALLGAHHQPAVQLFGYLFLLQIGLIVVTRTRRWWWLTVVALVAGLIWTAGWIAFAYDPAQAALVAVFLLSTVAAFVAGTWDVTDDVAGEFPLATLVGWIAVPVALLLSAALVKVGEFTNLDWAQLGLMSAAALVLGRLRVRYAPLPWVALMVTAGMLIMWATGGGGLNDAAQTMGPRFAWIGAALGMLFVGGAYACVFGSVHAAWFARLSAAAGVGFLVMLWWFVRADVVGAWWPWALVSAGLYAAMALPLWARLREAERASELDDDGEHDRQDAPDESALADQRSALAALAVACSSLVSIAVWWLVGEHELQRPWITVAWALQMPAVLWIARRLRVTELVVYAGLLGVACGVRLLLNPFVFEYPIGEGLVLNWITWGYGLPVIGYALSAWLARPMNNEASRGFETGAIATGFVMLGLLVRHGFHPDMGGAEPRLFELATYAVAWGALGVALIAAALRTARPVQKIAGVLITTGALAVTFFGPGLIANPWWEPANVGATPVFNGLLYVYGVPALLTLAAATLLRRRTEDAPLALGLEWGGWVTLAALVTLQVRHGFHPQWGDAPVTLFESATYAVVFGAVGLALALAAWWRKRDTLHHAAALAAAAALCAVVFGPVLMLNPLGRPFDVGEPFIFNGLLYLYGVPAVLAFLGARVLHWSGRRGPAIGVLGICGLGLLFLLVTLEVRHAFVGPILHGPAPTEAEGYAYSAAWIVFAIVLLVAALVIRTPIKAPLRWSSLAVMLIAVGKVFLYDTRELTDLWRVASFLGLGVSLFVIAWVYQRFVFTRPNDEDPAEPLAA